MRISVNGIVLKTEDIKEMKIAECKSRVVTEYRVYAVMKGGKKIVVGTEYTRLNAVTLANSCKPSFEYVGEN